jgi:ACDE family multidrug resistance protein
MASDVWNRYFGMIVGVTIINLLGMPIITPALPTIREALNVPTEHIGLVMAAYALPAIVAVPLAGLLADRYGKKVVLVPCLFLFAAAGGVAAPLSGDFETLIAARLVQGVAASGLSSLGPALVGDYFSGHPRVRVMGYLGALMSIGSGILPVIGGLLTLIAWNVPFLASLLALPLGLYAIYAVPEKSVAAGQRGRAFLGRALGSLADRRNIEIMILNGGFIFIGFGTFVTYVPIFLADTVATNAFFNGVIVSARTVSGSTASALLGRFAQRFSYRSLIVIAFLAQAVGLGIVPLLPNDWSVMITGLLYGGAFGVVRPALQLLMLENAPEDLRTTFSASISFSLRIAQTIGPAAAGALLAFADFGVLFYASAAIAAALAVLSLAARALKPAKP